jgi:hydrogenase maturation protease
MNPAIVIGIGNALLRDEGIGVHVARLLQRPGAVPPGTDVLDAGACGMKLVHLLAGRRRAALVDCALMGERPGTLRRFRPQDVGSIKALAGFSLHECDLMSVLRVSRELGDCPEEVVLFGIEPCRVEPGEELSDCLALRLDEYAGAVRDFCEEDGES